RRMELHEFHIHQSRTRVISERVSVPRILPAVAGDFVSPSNSSRRKNHSFSPKQVKSPPLAIISKRTRDAISIFQQGNDRVFHENVQTEMDSMVLKCTDHFQAGAVSDMC